MNEIKVQAKSITMVPTKELTPNPVNRNKHSKEQIEHLATQYEYQGMRNPIVVSNQSGLIVAGHGRLLAAKKAGLKEVPVSFQDFITPEQEYAYGIADNGTALWAELDLSGINADIQELGPDFDIDMLGLKGFTLDVSEKDGLTDEDSVPEVPKEAKSKLGDVYKLGEHRLMCGDSTSIDAVDKLMNGEKADMVFTDPPYGMKLDADYSFAKNTYSNVKSKGGNKYKNVAGDHEDFSPDLINTIFAAFSEAREMFLWGADYYIDLVPRRNEGSWVVWDKRQNDELDISKAKSADKAFGSSFELCWSKSKHKRLMARIRSGIFGVNNESGNSKRVHPTEKPIQLAKWFFEQWGNENDNVVDIYGGSGSTLIACEKTNRKCFMMELDPLYIDVIIERWEKFTGKKAELLSEVADSVPNKPIGKATKGKKKKDSH